MMVRMGPWLHNDVAVFDNAVWNMKTKLAISITGVNLHQIHEISEFVTLCFNHPLLLYMLT